MLVIVEAVDVLFIFVEFETVSDDLNVESLDEVNLRRLKHMNLHCLV